MVDALKYQYPAINWGRLAKAQAYYAEHGFVMTEVPWLVPDDISAMTLPPTSGAYTTQYGDLVGSAEQSFMCLQKYCHLPKGRYMAITPCFRDETMDQWHQPYFMKLELYVSEKPTQRVGHELAEIALGFFNTQFEKPCVIQRTQDGWDITFNDIELGSYGYRAMDKMKWCYGTGVAEPRCSMAIRHGQ